MAFKMYTGSPSLRLQFFEKRSVCACARGECVYSVYGPCHNEFAGKTAEDRAISSPVVGKKYPQSVGSHPT